MFALIKKIVTTKRIRKKVNLRGKKVVVMGIGLHGGGVSMIKWLTQQGARVVATDKKTRETLDTSIKKLSKLVKSKKIKLIIGRHRLDDFRSADLIIKNPAVPWTNTYIKQAGKSGIKVEMDSSLFFKLCPSKKIIGVTGTKGKTTTSHIINAILKKDGKKVVMVGTGKTTVMDRLRLIGKNTYVIFELSSWRLSALRKHKISPRYAVVTNIYPDHLNYYKTMRGYINDKLAIVKYQKKSGLAVLNYDNEETRKFSEKTKAEVSYYSTKDSYSIIQDVYLEDGKIKYRTDKKDGTICAVSELKILGHHNISNIMAGAAVAIRMKISPKVIRKAVIGFTGIKHRLEFVDKRQGVLFYNDSAATTPESAIAGVDAFLDSPEIPNIYLIAGGSSKKLDLKILADKIVKTGEVKKVVLLKGAASESLLKLIKKMDGAEKIVGVVDSMQEAVDAMNDQIENEENRRDNVEGMEIVTRDIVLLSPGCASFGLFDNEFDRGNQFRDIVKNLK
jgi:UDP-N-acetylmuramoylalanine--D-glutamate ligase